MPARQHNTSLAQAEPRERRRALQGSLLIAMANAGKPVEKVSGIYAANKLYHFTGGPHAGGLVRVRTNLAYALQMKAAGNEWDSPIPPLANVDYVAIACVNLQGRAEFYLVPAARVDQDLKEAHRARIMRMLGGRPTANDLRVLRFDHNEDYEWHGFARKYAEFRIDVEAAQEGPAETDERIARAYQMIADCFHVPVSAVRISVELVPGRVIAHLEANGS